MKKVDLLPPSAKDLQLGRFLKNGKEFVQCFLCHCKLTQFYFPSLLFWKYQLNNKDSTDPLLDRFASCSKLTEHNTYYFMAFYLLLSSLFFPLATGFLLLTRVIAVTFCVTLAASMAARLGTTPMAAFQICLQVWMTSSLLADGLAVAAQVWASLSLSLSLW